MIYPVEAYPELQRELNTYAKRTPTSAEAHRRNLKRLPLGVSSSYRAYDPYPLFVKEGSGAHFRDLDGNDYIDHNLCVGALIAGHCHPAVMEAVERCLHTGTLFGMPHELEWQLAEEICARFPLEMVRFNNSGTEATMYAIRLARAATGRDLIVKFEGGYHGMHDSVLVSMKPRPPDFGEVHAPTAVAGGLGLPYATMASTLVATFNDAQSVERRFAQNPGKIAAIILEPVMMNVGVCLPQPGFLEALRALCTRHGAMLIFDEIKTGGKLSWGGATEHFGVRPDMICLGKSIGGGLPLAVFGASREVMDLIAQRRVYHGGTYNTNPLSMSAGLATFREVLTRENYARVGKLGEQLAGGYRRVIAKTGLQAYVATAGANGALMLYPREVRNYRDWLPIDTDLWRHYWFGMVNRGVLALPYGTEEQWTISVQHTKADIEQHIATFEDLAPALAKAQTRAGRGVPLSV
jgi:glutamate-1-semialdehyde 2,1-aminomutase